MPALSLTVLARKACIKNIHLLSDLGDADYTLLRPVLLKIQNPKQLWELEQKSPQICGHDAEIWKEFCKRDIPKYEKDPVEPANPKSWYKCYLKLLKENQREVEEDAKQLKATLDGIKSKQAQRKAQQVELSGVKLLAGTSKNLPQIALPKNSSFFDKERPKHLDLNIVKYERDVGDIPATKLHKRDTYKQTAEKGTPKSSKLMSKIRKETLATSRFVNQARPGVIQGREMRTTQPPTASAMLAASRAQARARQTIQSPHHPITSNAEGISVISPKKRLIDEVDLSDTELPSPEPSRKQPKLSTAPTSTRIESAKNSATTTDQQMSLGKVAQTRPGSTRPTPSDIESRESRLMAVKTVPGLGGENSASLPITSTSPVGTILKSLSTEPDPSTRLNSTPEKSNKSMIPSNKTSSPQAKSRSPQPMMPPPMRKRFRASSNPMMVPHKRQRVV